MGWEIVLSASAESDLENIVSYIARHNPDAAIRVGNALISRSESLAEFPEMGRVVPEFSQKDLREVVYRSYRIIYRLISGRQRIEIVRFWHAARGLPHIPRL
jgi:toxin ParE1/3/4